MNFKDIPRLKVANLPTKMHEVARLNELIGGPRLYIKRDDETGLAFGGNKVRKLEYILANALDTGAEVVITSGGAQSNHGRLTAAVAIACGLKPVLVITDDEPSVYNGNLSLDYFLGADLHYVAPKENEDMPSLVARGEEKVLELQKEFEQNGKKAYVVPRGGRSVYATAGYYNATLEICQQINRKRYKIDYILTAFGSGSTFSSLVLANKLLNTGIKVIGISVAYDKQECIARVLEQIEDDKEFYNLDVHISKEDFIIFDHYIGPGYAIPTAEGINAIKLLAQTEAIFLDPNYTGKAMAGLIDLVDRNYFNEDDGVLFLHTGGTPALFNLDDEYYRSNKVSFI